MLDPRKARESRIAGGHQVCQRASREVGQGDAVAHVTTGVAHAGRWVVSDAGVPVTGDAQRSAPCMRELDAFGRREKVWSDFGEES